MGQVERAEADAVPQVREEHGLGRSQVEGEDAQRHVPAGSGSEAVGEGGDGGQARHEVALVEA
ncbi:hypothetical protein [Streptomyces finlayi]|uniref:hypothetical protein n=1 Tax=Streptomyces finlayi TaxID=67296 RepID=UPI002156188C|nr:hypothetical protein [Streptomyces finlayi]